MTASDLFSMLVKYLHWILFTLDLEETCHKQESLLWLNCVQFLIIEFVKSEFIFICFQVCYRWRFLANDSRLWKNKIAALGELIYLLNNSAMAMDESWSC